MPIYIIRRARPKENRALDWWVFSTRVVRCFVCADHHDVYSFTIIHRVHHKQIILIKHRHFFVFSMPAFEYFSATLSWARNAMTMNWRCSVRCFPAVRTLHFWMVHGTGTWKTLQLSCAPPITFLYYSIHLRRCITVHNFWHTLAFAHIKLVILIFIKFIG